MQNVLFVMYDSPASKKYFPMGKEIIFRLSFLYSSRMKTLNFHENPAYLPIEQTWGNIC